MTSPSYLRDLAAKFRAKGTLTHNATAERLLEIAGELDHLTAGGTVVARDPDHPHADRRDLTTGTNRKLADLRRAQNMPAPTLEELKALREELAKGKP